MKLSWRSAKDELIQFQFFSNANLYTLQYTIGSINAQLNVTEK